jgi:hypothetical protein
VVDGKAGLSPSHRTIAFRNRALVPEEPFEEEVTVLNSTEGDFDFNEPDGPSGQPRLVHFDFEGAVEFVTDVGPRAALVEVNPTTRVPVDVPSVIDEPEALAWLIDESSDFIGSTMLTNRPEEMFASLTVNHAVNGSQSTVETSAHAAFNLSAEFSSGEDGYDHFTQDLKQDAQARDDWQEPARGGSVAQPTATPTEDNLDYPDITWRFSGVPREISAQQVGTVEKVSTDREVLLDDGVEALSSSLFPHVATNGANLIDNFATFVTTSGGSQEINLVHIDP